MTAQKTAARETMLGLASEMPKNSARRAFLWQLIAKNRKRRLALYTALRTVYQRRQLLLEVACLTVLLLANNNGAAVLRSVLPPFPTQCWLV